MSRRGSGSVRLSTGDLRGTVLPVSPRVRPTSGRVREALLSSWQDRLPGARLLDLFAGSGAVGLEALGRGADELVGLESDARVLGDLRRAYERVANGRAMARRGHLPKGLERAVGRGPFDLIFADPPYDFANFEALISGCGRLLTPAGELVVEHSSRATLPEATGGLRRERARRFGESVLSHYRPTGEPPENEPPESEPRASGAGEEEE